MQANISALASTKYVELLTHFESLEAGRESAGGQVAAIARPMLYATLSGVGLGDTARGASGEIGIVVQDLIVHASIVESRVLGA